MKVTGRAIVAVGLLAGFYLIVGAFAAAAIALDVNLILRQTGLQAAVGMSIVAGVLIRALIVVSRQKSAEQPGVEVKRESEPILWQTVTDLAERVQTQPPDEIRIVPEVNAAVSEDTKFLGLKATRRRMYIGMPLLVGMTADEMRSVLGHELGHYSGSHTRLGAPVYRGRISLIAAVNALEGHRLVQRLFVAYAKFFFRVSLAVSRRQELEADELSVEIAGRATAASALRKVHGLAPAWDFFLQRYAALIGPAQMQPNDLFSGFAALISDPERQREMATIAASTEETSPYDSHPSLPDRLAAIDRLPELAVAPDQRPATVLLRDPAAVARATAESLLTGEARALPAASWDELVARGMYVATNRDAAVSFAVAGQRLISAPQPYLDAGLEALARGQAAELHADLVGQGWTDDEGLLAHVVARSLEAAVIEHGGAHWALSWSSSPVLLTAAGQELELDEFAAAVARYPSAQVPAAREWLLRSGVRADYIPQHAREPMPA